MVSLAALLANDRRLDTETLALGGREAVEEEELEAEAGVGGVAAKRDGQLGSERGGRKALRVAGDEPTKLGRLSSLPVEGRIEPQAFRVAIALARERRTVFRGGGGSARRESSRISDELTSTCSRSIPPQLPLTCPSCLASNSLSLDSARSSAVLKLAFSHSSWK